MRGAFLCEVRTPQLLWRTCKPGSVGPVKVRMIIPLGSRSPDSSSSRPAASLSRWAPLAAYLALLPLGVAVPRCVADRAVGSYPAVSPLPTDALVGGFFSVALSVARCDPDAQALPGSAPNGARTFLEPRNRRGRDHPVRHLVRLNG